MGNRLCSIENDIGKRNFTSLSNSVLSRHERQKAEACASAYICMELTLSLPLVLNAMGC